MKQLLISIACLLLLILRPQLVNAVPCTSASLPQMARIPVQDQGELNICESYAMSTAIDHWRISNGEHVDRFTSTIDIAYNTFGNVNYIKNDDNALRVQLMAAGETNSIDMALPAINKNGVCEDVLSDPSYFFQLLIDKHHQYQSLSSAFTQNHPQLQDHTSYDHENSLLIKEAKKKEFENETNEYFQPAVESFECSLSPDLQKLTKLNKEVTKKLLAEDLAQSIKYFIDQTCKGNRRKFEKPLKFKKYPISSLNSIKDSLAKLFTGKNPQPALMGYCSNYLDKDKNYRRMKLAPNGKENESPDCDGHMSLLIARKQENNKCYYLIRNSWGSSCDTYAKTGWECKNGDTWVDEDTVASNLDELQELSL